MGAQNARRQCVILGAGKIADYPAVAAEIADGAFVLCADGGYYHCKALGVVPDLLIGDFDSLGAPLPSDLPQIALPPDKDYTDATLALAHARSLGFRDFLLTGMLGGRLDHTLANLQNLADCARRGHSARITDGSTWGRALAALEGPAELALEPRPNHYFSLIALSERCEGVTIKGGLYPLEDYPLLNHVPRAVSNEFTGEPVTVSLREGVLLVLSMPKTA